MLLTVPFYRWGKLRTSDQSKVTQLWNGGASILNIQSDLSIPDACAVVRRLPTDTACLPYALSRAYAAHNTVYLRCQEIRHTSALRAPSPGEERMQLQKKSITNERQWDKEEGDTKSISGRSTTECPYRGGGRDGEGKWHSGNGIGKGTQAREDKTKTVSRLQNRKGLWRKKSTEVG